MSIDDYSVLTKIACSFRLKSDFASSIDPNRPNLFRGTRGVVIRNAKLFNLVA